MAPSKTLVNWNSSSISNESPKSGVSNLRVAGRVIYLFLPEGRSPEAKHGARSRPGHRSLDWNHHALCSWCRACRGLWGAKNLTFSFSKPCAPDVVPAGAFGELQNWLHWIFQILCSRCHAGRGLWGAVKLTFWISCVDLVCGGSSSCHDSRFCLYSKSWRQKISF